MGINANFINDTTTLSVVKALYDNVGGSWFTTIMLVVLFVVLIAIICRIPMEVTAIFILPFLLVCLAYVPDIASVVGVLLLYIGFIAGKMWFFNR